MDIYADIALLAGFGILFNAVAGPIRRSVFSDAFVFVAFGYAVGPTALGLLGITVEAESARLLAELALAVVLFSDAAGANLGVLRRDFLEPVRLLGIGLPLTIAAGWLVARLVFPELTTIEAAVLATILAPTDAALGKAVVTNPSVPADVREVLNVESGLNDGICVPLLLAFLALAGPAGEDRALAGLLAEFAINEIGIGLIVGATCAGIGYGILLRSAQAGWIEPAKLSVPVLALSLLAFAAAQTLGGSGFIAAFTGGLLFGALTQRHRQHLLEAAEVGGGLLSFLTWIIFGASVVGPLLQHIDVATVAYAVLSLTVIRMLPVFLALLGTDYDIRARLFMGWFGPRGLATVVFVVIVAGEFLPHAGRIATVAMTTVLLSIIAHGLTATPLAAAFGRRKGTSP